MTIHFGVKLSSRYLAICLSIAAPTALWAPGAAAEPTQYEGVCEASAAAILDDSHFAVASDETERLTIYERGKAEPVSTHPLTDVTDLEAAARIGDTIFWLTSHSFNKDGEDKTKRKLLFATSVGDDPSLTDAGTVFRDLRATIASILGIDEATLAASLNIEGLAATPDGKLLVGLRAPLTEDGRARVVRIDNPFALVGLPAPAAGVAPDSISPVSALKLGGRGIRSIELVGTGEHRFLIVAGPVQDHAAESQLYWWDGDKSHDPVPGPAAPLAGIAPEALIAWDDHVVQVIGDNGDACSDEKPGQRWFPSIDVNF